MHSNQSAGPRCHPPGDLLGCNVEGPAVNICKNRRSAAIDRHIGSCDPRKGRHDYLVAWTDLQRRKGEMQTSRRRRNGDGILDTVTAGEGTLKCSDFGTLRDPTALDRLAQRLPFFVAHARCSDGYLTFPFAFWHKCPAAISRRRGLVGLPPLPYARLSTL